MDVTASITTITPREEVERALQTSEEIAALRELGETRLELRDAPGDRGTEVRAHVTSSMGAVRSAIGKLTGDDPRAGAFDRLRRFKQVLETGELARSDGAPEGTDHGNQPKQQPAQPAAETEEVVA